MANVSAWDLNLQTNTITVVFDTAKTAPSTMPSGSLYLVPSSSSVITTYDLFGAAVTQTDTVTWSIVMTDTLVYKIKTQTTDFTNSANSYLRAVVPFVDADSSTLVRTYTVDTVAPNPQSFVYTVGNTAAWNMAITTADPIISNTFTPNKITVRNGNPGNSNYTLTGGTAWFSNGVTYLKFTQADYTSIQAVWANAVSNINSVYATFAANLGNNWVGIQSTAPGSSIRATSVNPGTLPAGYKLSSVQDLQILGGSNGQALLTDGTGNLSFGVPVTPLIANGNSNVSIATANGAVTVSANGTANIVTVDSANGLSVTISSNSNVSMSVRNSNNANTATSDIRARSDVATSTQGFVDIGITSSTYNVNAYSVLSKQDSYVFAVGNTTAGANYSPGNLVIGAFTDANSRVKIGAGVGYYANSVVLTVGNRTLQANVSNVSIGANTGNGQGANAIAIGNQAASFTQGNSAIAIGNGAAVGNSSTGQGAGAIAIGASAVGNVDGNAQGQYAIAIGNGAGYSGQGEGAIAIGFQAAYPNYQPANTIVINGTGLGFSTPANIDSGLFVQPIRLISGYNKPLSYDPFTGEIAYSNTAGTVTTQIASGNTSMGVTALSGPIQTNVGNVANVLYISDTAVSVNENLAVTGNITLGNNTSNYNINLNGRQITSNTYGISSNLIYLEGPGNISIGSGPNLANTFLMTDGNGHLSWANPTITTNVQPVSAIAQFTFSGNTAAGNGTVSNAQPELIDWTFSSDYSANAGAQVWGQASFSTGANTTTTNTSIRYLNGQYIATRSDGTIVTSADGVTWSSPITVSSVAGDILTDINYGGTATGGAGASYVVSTTRSYSSYTTGVDIVWYISQDLVTWTRKTLTTVNANSGEAGTRSVSYASINGQFIWLMTAVYNSRLYIYKSNDLLSWSVTGAVGGYAHYGTITSTTGKVVYGGGGWIVNPYYVNGGYNFLNASAFTSMIWSSDASVWNQPATSAFWNIGFDSYFGRDVAIFYGYGVISINYVNGYWIGYGTPISGYIEIGGSPYPYYSNFVSNGVMFFGTSADPSTWNYYGIVTSRGSPYSSAPTLFSSGVGNTVNAAIAYDPVNSTYLMYSGSTTSFGVSTQNAGSNTVWSTTFSGSPGFTPQSMTNRRTRGGFLVVGSPPSPNPTSQGGTGKLLTFASTRTSYLVSLPFSSYTSNSNVYTYPAQTFTFEPGLGSNYVAVASSLGNAISNIRPTWTATYPSNGVLRMNTNYNEDIGTVSTVSQTSPPVTGTLTLNISQQGSAGIGGSRDIVTINDNLTLQQYIYVPPFNQSIANLCADITATSTLASWVVTTGANNDSVILTQRTAGFISYGAMPTANVIRGSLSTLAVNRSSVNQGQATQGITDVDFRQAPANVFFDDGTANAAWANYIASQVFPTGSSANTQVTYNSNGRAGGSNALTFNYTSNTLNVSSNSNSYTTISGPGIYTTGAITANGSISTGANFVISGGGFTVASNGNVTLTSTNGRTTTLRANSAVTANYSLAWPNTGGINGQVLTSDGAGNLVWVTTASTTGAYSISNGNSSVTTFPDANVAITAGNVANANQIIVSSGTTTFNTNVRILTGTIALGNLAGNANGVVQGNGAIAIGNYAAQGTLSAGQGISAIAIGNYAAGYSSSVQAANAIAIGLQAGYQSQGTDTVAIGRFAGYGTQAANGIAIGANAGYSVQSSNAIAIGANAAYSSQGTDCIAIGANAGYINQSLGAISVGYQSGYSSQRADSIAIGRQAGYSGQTANSIAIGYQAGYNSQQGLSIAIGANAGNYVQGAYTVAIGFGAGATSQQSYAIAIGQGAALNTQGTSAIAIGREAAGSNAQGTNAVAIGYQAGYSGQNGNAIAVGRGAGTTNQGGSAIAIGAGSANTGQGTNSIAIGNAAGQTNQGSYSIAIGYAAGQTNQQVNSVVLNASGSALNANASGLYVNPVRLDNTNSANIVFYNAVTKEMSYSAAAGTVLPYRFLGNTQSYFDIAAQDQIQAVLPTFPTPKDGDYFVDTNTATNNQQPVYLYVNGLWRQLFTAYNI